MCPCSHPGRSSAGPQRNTRLTQEQVQGRGSPADTCAADIVWHACSAVVQWEWAYGAWMHVVTERVATELFTAFDLPVLAPGLCARSASVQLARSTLWQSTGVTQPRGVPVPAARRGQNETTGRTATRLEQHEGLARRPYICSTVPMTSCADACAVSMPAVLPRARYSTMSLPETRRSARGPRPLSSFLKSHP